MSNEPVATGAEAGASREEMMSAHFANLVMQSTNMALTFLGHSPHPETGARVTDLDTARVFIDQLEMLEVKTRGNLDKREESLLQQSLTGLRMAFVQAVESGPPEDEAAPKPTAAATSAQPESAAQETPLRSGDGAGRIETDPTAPEDSKKKFSKKY